MASLKDLRDRIDSVKATQKITRAMQMVAAAKLRRAQAAAAAARPYAERLEAVLADAAASVTADAMPPLMRGSGSGKTHLALICTSDRGLCGGFNMQIVREARAFLRARQAEGKKLKILAVGKKGADMLRREFGACFLEEIDLSHCNKIGFDQARAIADKVLMRYDRGEFDVCTLFYSRFKSVIRQDPQAERLIPQAEAGKTAGEEAAAAGREPERETARGKAAAAARGSVYYEYEPHAAEVLADLALRALSTRIFRALLENAAGEMGAKMTAMDNATRNAGEMISTLSVSYNRRRQARITTELIEIIAGAEAL